MEGIAAKYSYRCHECKLIIDRAPHGKCPSCQSDNVWPVERLVQGAAEREAWFNRIYRRERD